MDITTSLEYHAVSRENNLDARLDQYGTMIQNNVIVQSLGKTW